MEQFSGASNWKLTIQRKEDSIAILRAVTCDDRAVLPDTLFGLPVTELGHHALSPTIRQPVEGEEVLITCGLPEREWNNRPLREVTLPAGLRQAGDYTFLNCWELETLHLHDGVNLWGGGALMNCRALHRIFLTTEGEQGETLSYFADVLSRELDVTLERPDGLLRLIFPEYLEIYEENCPARNFDYNIQGGGYPYHHCFRRKKLSLQTYDSLWKDYMGMEHDESEALRLAWWRLRYPVELSARAEEDYWAYVKHHTGFALRWLLEQRDTPGLSFLLARTEPSREELAQACALARESGAAEALAILLEAQHRRFSHGKSFDL